MRVSMDVLSQQIGTLSLANHRSTPDVFTHRKIVTVFICTFHGGSFEDFKVAIFKRSAQTNSHQ